MKWPNIYKTVTNGITRYVVDARIYHQGQRSGNREHFETLEQAKGRADNIRQNTKLHGRDIGTIPDTTAAQIKQGEEELKKYGKSVLDAVRFYKKWLDDNTVSYSVEESVALWLTEKEKKKLSQRTIDTARFRINLFKTKFSGRKLKSLTHSDLESWFDELQLSERTKINIKAIVSEFFKFCMRSDRKWIEYNPTDVIDFGHINRKEAAILTPTQSEKILKVAESSSDTLAYSLLGLFAGLRPSEVEILQWKDINFSTNEIRVVSLKIKDVRYVPINPPLSARLLKLKTTGKIINENWRKKWDAVKNLAGFNKENPYPADCLRHSYASYWLAMSLAGVAGYEGGRSRLAEIMGNSESVIRKHYRKAIPKSEAKEFWKLIT